MRHTMTEVTLSFFFFGEGVLIRLPLTLFSLAYYKRVNSGLNVLIKKIGQSRIKGNHSSVILLDLATW